MSTTGGTDKIANEAEFIALVTAFEQIEPAMHMNELPFWVEKWLGYVSTDMLNAAGDYRPTTEPGVRALARMTALEFRFYNTGDMPGPALSALLATLGAEELLDEDLYSDQANTDPDATTEH